MTNNNDIARNIEQRIIDYSNRYDDLIKRGFLKKGDNEFLLKFLNKFRLTSEVLALADYQKREISISTREGIWHLYSNDKYYLGMFSRQRFNIPSFVFRIPSSEIKEYELMNDLTNITGIFENRRFIARFFARFASDSSREYSNAFIDDCYEFNPSAIHGLKSEAFSRQLDLQLRDSSPMDFSFGSRLKSLDDINADDQVELDAVPLSPFNQSPTNNPTKNDIRDDSALEWLMKDGNGKSFVLWGKPYDYDYGRKLSELLCDDLIPFFEKLKQVSIEQYRYPFVAREHIGKLSMQKADVIYAKFLEQGQFPVEERMAFKIYGYVTQSTDLPRVQLTAVKSNDGLIITQPYNIDEIKRKFDMLIGSKE